MRRGIAISTVVLFVAMAGCLGGFGPDTAGEAPTTETIALDSVDYPEHTSQDGIGNATEFVNAMRTHLDDSGYSANYTSTVRSGTGYAVRVDYNAETSEAYMRQLIPDFTADGRDKHVEVYLDGRNEHVYDNFSEGPIERQGTAWEPLVMVGHAGVHRAELDASHAIERGGTTLIVYDITAYRSGGQRYTNASGRAVIDEDGVLREYTLSFHSPLPGNLKSVTFTLTPGNPTIEPPDWTDDAVPESNET